MKKLVAFLLATILTSNINSQQFINHRGQDIFVSGINMAWMNFARDMAGFDEARFTSTMEDIKNAGGNATRWWLHINGTETPTFRGDTVVGINPLAISNFVKALDIAAENGIVISVCLWSFDMLVRDQVSATQLQRNKNLLENANLTQFYIDNALLPLVQATKSHPAILCWEIFNEPEGMTPVGGWGHTEKVQMSDVQRFINQCAGAIRRADTTAKISSGCWNSKAISYNTEISNSAYNYYADTNLIAIGGDPDGYLDFYQVHFYPDYSPDRESPFHNHAEYYQLEKPLLIGEFSAHGIIRKPGARFAVTSELTPHEAYNWLIENGYAGGLSWTYTNHDGHGGLDDIRSTLKYLNDTYPDLINIQKADNFNYKPYITKNLPDTALYCPPTPLSISHYIDLNDYFVDDESDLNFEVETIGIVSANITDLSILNITIADTVGYGKVLINAYDTEGKSIAASFYVYSVDTLETNLALNKAVYSSSIESTNRDIFYINDGDYATRWSSQYNDDEHFIIDLHTPQTVSRVVLNWESAYGKKYEILVSSDNTNWTRVFYTDKGNSGINNIVFESIETRYIKFNGIKRGTNWGYSIFEFEIYASNGRENNTSPYFTNTEYNFSANAEEEFQYNIRSHYLKDEDGDILDYELELIDAEQPDWMTITFNNNEKHFGGIAPNSEIGNVYTFKLTAIDYFQQSAFFTFSLTINEALGNTELLNNDFVLYPIPSKHSLNLKAQTTADKIEIYNSVGQMVYTYTNILAKQIVTVKNLETGLYKMKIISNKKIYYKNFIIEK